MSSYILVRKGFLTAIDFADEGYCPSWDWAILHVESAGSKGSQAYTLVFPTDDCSVSSASFKVAARVINLASSFNVVSMGKHRRLIPQGNQAQQAYWMFIQYSEDCVKARNALRFSL